MGCTGKANKTHTHSVTSLKKKKKKKKKSHRTRRKKLNKEILISLNFINIINKFINDYIKVLFV